MNTLIVFNHPYEGSYCNAILEAVRNGLEQGGHHHDVIHLDNDGFDPVMRGKDLKAFAMAGRLGEAALEEVDPLIMTYKTRLEWAERLVMIFPIWWMTMPAMMKGFIDKVIFPAIAYNMDGGRLKSRLQSLRSVIVISTMNTPAEIYRNMFGNSLEGSLIKGTFKQIGITDVEWISLNEVKQVTDEQRKAWLDGIEAVFRKPVG
ncbi:MAG: NAD(P)H-dependent oxidoreductase [Bacteroidales bacterium]|nr:NAD(P)H-dependent oxidoreductase [Bacteroidales bacterium]